MERWNRAMAAIEEALDADIEVAALARHALTSEYELRRVFSVLTGIPLSEYIRRRRMTVAAAAIVADREAVQDIAVRYGYSSADAFSRAFRAVHGVGPEQARQPGAVLRTQPRLTFHLRIEGSSEMRYRIVRKDAFRLVGRKARIPLVYEGPNQAMIEFEQNLGQQERERIAAPSNEQPTGELAVCHNFDESREDGSSFDYYVAAATTSAVPADLDVIDVPASTWVVFEAAEPTLEAIQQVWPQAFGDWFPANPYRAIPAPEIVRADYDEDGALLGAEVWLAVESTA
ncbi:AraC family transcriptional regulator [Rhodococcus triatomae]|uniref:AraC family transcriptional regulator n=1 Tax=Rhodococcus triatomae TaxID=300028 RepID=A0A1G8SKM8_9NOCA|nr:AraC family transcriptional regulator [Rhodococcus triatomae]QNG18697.1 AraC family transcriptional regulator [Rhodococcus triatomae]QNG25392.1 AraC family transcriptional regulator [Rhodococcus triatomae]SDJ29798.1 AraC family transcriptional regulator [Rhodococcus triatomae]